ncbi:uncharacterized protein N7446_003005 [Penicillium canescens]|uniref:GST N-terminal domain-containing protein n=1 Tax=Penicillium canescens TaxID=5083 RepID=A0AAD6IFR8_PENCN|nr:uncharacterized protein N7446_003005 [Penicillium canescens]KAJ6044811.1 hypothetical protein N7460_006166 [Penicillium canescens]KAJ6056280.1 hypothetical protein N7444_005378 [Penicillium canescens]KAJ6075228.1 hypothetical protein N7446_003005 [Penicillium canescens]
MASKQYTLYDLPSKAPCSTWSPNPWKTRLLFNLKGLDYRTEWVEYPDIKPTLENKVPANTEGVAYSIPTIESPDGTCVMDSRKIADYIEKEHPQPSMHLDSSYLPKVEELWSAYMRAICPIFLAWVPRDILNDASLEFWYTTREKFFGMPVDQLEKTKGGVLAWNEAEPALRGATALLKENQGPFFLGETVSYADLVWASVLIFSKRLGPGFFEEALKRSGDAQVHLDLLEALRPVSERDGY